MNFITGDKFKSLSEDFLDQSKTFLDLSKKPRIIFLFTDWVDAFKKQILPNIDYKFKLITHNADTGVYEKDLDLLNDDRLIRWFGMNCYLKHPKLTSIPIGIANKKWAHGNEELLQKVIDMDLPKVNKIYCNFNENTSFARVAILKNLIEKENGLGLINFDCRKLDQEEYWKKLASYKYTISPPGNGVDCHRIWESMYLKTIPICLENISLTQFAGLPMISIGSYDNLGEELPKNVGSLTSPLDFNYWKNKIINEY